MTSSRRSRTSALLAALLLAAASLPAQTPTATTISATTDYQPLQVDRGTSALQQSLRKLNTRASLMMIVAHPDDEDGGMLTYESRGQGARVALLTLTRGEGGQNVMSNDLWDALALVRTQELLAAGRRYGVDQYFTRVADFGFSKTLDEAFTTWGKERVLYDVVRAVRMNRPLVLAASFVGGITDGHGQHQVSGEMAQEVFKAAGDPNVFPDQIKAGLLPWTPLKVYARVPAFSISPKGMYDYATGKWAPVRFYDYVSGKWTDAVPTTTLKISEGAYDPALGGSYIQLGREGLNQQKSQNGGTGIPLPGTFDVPYHRYGSRVTSPDTEKSFFDGIDISLLGIAALAPGQHPFLAEGLHQIAASVEQATRQPDKITPLAAGLKQTQLLIQKVEASTLTAEQKYNIKHELEVKQAQFNSALIEALGVTLTAVVSPANPDRGRSPFAVDAQDTFTTAVPGLAFGVSAYLTNPSAVPIQVQNVSIRSTGTGDWHITNTAPVHGLLQGNQRQTAQFHVAVPEDATLTQACFHRKSLAQSFYDLDSVSCLDHPLPPYPLEAWLEFTVDGVTVRSGQAVQTVQHQVGVGGVYEPLVVAPGISVATTATAGIVPLGQSKPVAVNVRVRTNISSKTPARLHLDLPAGWQSQPDSVGFSEAQTISFAVTPKNQAEQTYPVTAVADFQGHSFTQGYETVGYQGLRPYNYYHPGPYKLVGVDVKVAPDLKVGYVMGTGDDVPESLQGLGLQVHLLSTADINSSNLAALDVIVLGVRAYAARPELAANNTRLLDYVKQGGVIVVQYNSGEYDHNYGPYPLTLSRDPEKVVDEAGPVQLLEPDSPLLSWPNKITDADFKGWVEERGHSFMQSWDKHYEALTEMHDPDQDQQKGGLLYARYGKGAYIYMAYALYRQLPEGVPGAYRLFANLLSLPKAPNFAASSTHP
jgi:LmbE family N-acetylglucosaminyl deacetylase